MTEHPGGGHWDSPVLFPTVHADSCPNDLMDTENVRVNCEKIEALDFDVLEVCFRTQNFNTTHAFWSDPWVGGLIRVYTRSHFE